MRQEESHDSLKIKKQNIPLSFSSLFVVGVVAISVFEGLDQTKSSLQPLRVLLKVRVDKFLCC